VTKIGTWVRRWGKAIIYPMIVAQAVGLWKLEIAFWLSGWMENGTTMRLIAYGIGITLSFATTYVNILIARRYS